MSYEPTCIQSDPWIIGRIGSYMSYDPTCIQNGPWITGRIGSHMYYDPTCIQSGIWIIGRVSPSELVHHLVQPVNHCSYMDLVHNVI